MPRKAVLIVDDSPIIADRMENMLKGLEEPGPISRSADYSSALRALSTTQPEVVLLDINLPGGSGIVLLQLIKTKYPSTCVIMVTNQSGDYYRRICQKLGADHFIDKSKEFECIPEIIASLP